MGRFEDALEGLRQKVRARGFDEGPLDVLESYKGSELRKKAERTDRLEQENEAVKAENRRLKARRTVEAVLTRYGVKTAELRRAEWEVLVDRVPESGTLDETWVAEQVSSLALPVERTSRPLSLTDRE